jgi:phospholipid/cholesterol/gamma-HCH transport system permease protein
MRTNDEIDALETSGINPMRFLIGTRLAAAWLAMPFLIIVGLAFTNLGHFLVVVVQLGDISQGGWELVHWALQSPTDILFALIKTMFMGTVILLVALYYGFHASGGPVGVGNATANSMIFNMVVVNITATSTTMIFWGLDARLPIGG